MTSIDRLPPEVTAVIVEQVAEADKVRSKRVRWRKPHMDNTKALSLVNKRLRHQTLPYLFTNFRLSRYQQDIKDPTTASISQVASQLSFSLDLDLTSSNLPGDLVVSKLLSTHTFPLLTSLRVTPDARLFLASPEDRLRPLTPLQSQITSLKVAYNFSPSEVAQLVSFFPNLTDLELTWEFHVEEPGMGELADALRDHPSLLKLVIDHNQYEAPYLPPVWSLPWKSCLTHFEYHVGVFDLAAWTFIKHLSPVLQHLSLTFFDIEQGVLAQSLGFEDDGTPLPTFPALQSLTIKQTEPDLKPFIVEQFLRIMALSPVTIITLDCNKRTEMYLFSNLTRTVDQFYPKLQHLDLRFPIAIARPRKLAMWKFAFEERGWDLSSLKDWSVNPFSRDEGYYEDDSEVEKLEKDVEWRRQDYQAVCEAVERALAFTKEHVNWAVILKDEVKLRSLGKGLGVEFEEDDGMEEVWKRVTAAMEEANSELERVVKEEAVEDGRSMIDKYRKLDGLRLDWLD
ncbi:hypothetical protein T439DRAFT_381867 [Meredithblackwellia eburnea MCA 4105]